MNERKLKKSFKSLQRDNKSVLFTEESINNKLLKRLKKPNYVRDNEFAKLFATVDFSFLEENERIPRLNTTILVIIFWNLTIFYYRFDSPQVKRNLISSAANLVYELPHELPNDLTLRILGN